MTKTEIVKGMYAAFNRGDISGVVNGLTEDIDWLTPGEGVIPYAGHFHTRAEVQRFFDGVVETTDFEPFIIEQYIEQGNDVVALGSYKGVAKQTGNPFTSRWLMLFTFRGDKVSRFEEHFDTAALGSAYAPAMAARR